MDFYQSMYDAALPTYAVIMTFVAWRFSRHTRNSLKLVESMRTCLDKTIELTRRYAHDRLHYAFVATILSQCTKTEGLSLSVKTNPALMALNHAFTDGSVITCGAIAKQRNILPGINLDLDANDAVVGIEVLGNQIPEEGDEWKGEDDLGSE